MLESKKYKILIVDDEASFMRGVVKNLSIKFDILTASGPFKAERIIKERADEIGMIVSDHKMKSELLGLDFLKKIHKKYPDITKILITAYSTRQLAIEAVNSGVIYQYISKPIKKEVFDHALIKGYELFVLKREKKFLLEEKTRILDRLVSTDRIRNLSVLAAGLSGWINCSQEALKKFLSVMPADFFSDNIEDISSEKKIMEGAKQKSKIFFDLIEHINKTLSVKNYNYETYSLNNIINKSVSEIKNNNKVNITLEFNNFDRQIKTCFFIIKNLFKNIIEYSVNEGAKDILIKLTEETVINQTKGIKILFKSDANRNKKGMWNLLPVFFGVFHCMGDIELIGHSDILISLPLDPDKAFIESAEIPYLDDFFEQFEAVKFYETCFFGIK